MKEWTITFLDAREPLTIKGDTFAKAVEAYLKTNSDLSYANLSYADLRYADLRYADLSNADLSYADLRYADLSNAVLSNADLRCAVLSNAVLRYAVLSNADLDFSCLPLWCGSLDIKIDKRIACQLLYHTLRAMQSVEVDEIKAILNDDKVLALANQFHRVSECGSIVKEQPNDQKLLLSEREKLINSLIFHVYDCMCQDIETETLKQWLDQIQQVIQVEPKDNL